MTEFGQPRRHMAECESTNDLARAWATDREQPAPHGALVTADFQTKGRGRRGHTWDAAPAESALMSFVLRPRLAPADAWQLGFLTALAAAEGLRALGVEVRLKWPNDILLNGRKVGGVLVETVLHPEREGEGSMTAIAGIGVNINQTRFGGAHYAYPPTSLRQETGRAWRVADAVDAVAAAFDRWNETFQEGGFSPIFDSWQERLAVGAALKRGPETGTLVGLLPDGRARVRLSNGTFAEWLTLD